MISHSTNGRTGSGDLEYLHDGAGMGGNRLWGELAAGNWNSYMKELLAHGLHKSPQHKWGMPTESRNPTAPRFPKHWSGSRAGRCAAHNGWDRCPNWVLEWGPLPLGIGTTPRRTDFMNGNDEGLRGA